MLRMWIKRALCLERRRRAVQHPIVAHNSADGVHTRSRRVPDVVLCDVAPGASGTCASVHCVVVV
jgi:hypothetical protein